MTDLTPTTERARAVVAGVREDQLDAPTPMPGTSVRELLNHLLGLTVAFRDAAAKLDGPTTNAPTRAAAAPTVRATTLLRTDLVPSLGMIAGTVPQHG